MSFLFGVWELTFGWVDIIGLLVVGVVLLVMFVVWQGVLEGMEGEVEGRGEGWAPPPIMKVSLWGREQGRYAAMMGIAFVSWCAFASFLYWMQVGDLFLPHC